jgi:ubiquinone biosynthesis protein
MAGAGELGKAMSGLPAIASRAIGVLEQLEVMVRDGMVLAPETIAAIARARARQNRWRTVALWVIAITFLGILWAVR